MDLSLGDAILLIVIVLVSVILHENAHGWTALALGDTTAKNAGRLTLNPVSHIDPFGSILLPALMAFTTGGAFGYAKPVPVNPWQLKGRDKWGFATVALAGPVSNMVLAVAGSVALAATVGDGFFDPTSLWLKFLLFWVEVNILLAAFNLVPIPPLDGSRLLRVALSAKGRQTLDRIEPYGFVIILVLIVWLDEPFFRVVDVIRSALVRLLPL